MSKRSHPIFVLVKGVEHGIHEPKELALKALLLISGHLFPLGLQFRVELGLRICISREKKAFASQEKKKDLHL